MKGDFTRDTFDPLKHFSRVLMQQGRVTLDADHNEQTAILLHCLRTLAKDLIGPFGVPVSDAGGFALSALDGRDIGISAGRCYVDGILVENDEEAASYLRQPHHPADPADFAGFLKSGKAADLPFLLYLDVWERHVTWIEDGSLRDIALGDTDTCTRAEVVWQLKAAISGQKNLPTSPEAIEEVCKKELLRLVKLERERIAGAMMTARLLPQDKTKNACITAPESRYRGLENHLYRVEIHDGNDPKSNAFTFKWSRDNGSVASSIIGLAANVIEVVNSRGFEPGIWVEIGFDEQEAKGEPGWMVKLIKVEGNRLVADTTTVPKELPTAWKEDFARSHPKVRRWDQAASENLRLVDGVIKVDESTFKKDQWIDLEEGIQVSFSSKGHYRSGDYWLIPARVANGRIEWPEAIEETGEWTPEPLPPHGVEHHYAPLGLVNRDNVGRLLAAQCLCTISPIGQCTGQFKGAQEEKGLDLKKPVKNSPAR
jgi:hypothetical protein